MLPDLAENQDYGKLIMKQPDKAVDLDDIRADVEQVHRRSPVDVLIVDYLNMVKLSHHGDMREAKNEMIRDAKRFATTFDKGRGILLISPWQINRQGVTRAAANDGNYDMSALSSNNEVEKSADAVYTIYSSDELQAINEAKIGCLKMRDHRKADSFHMFVRQDCRRMEDMRGGESELGDLGL